MSHANVSRLLRCGALLAGGGICLAAWSQGTAPPAPPEGPAEEHSLGLLGSAHDFSRGDAHPRDLCLPCHAPHLPGAEPPLWDPRSAAGDPIRAYDARTIELSTGSLLCLSCHDGIVAGDVFTAAHATRLASQVGASRVGNGGLGGHPVGIRYVTGSPDYHPLAAVTGGEVMSLPDGRIQCTTCHDPHNRGRHPGMLVTSNERSRLCLRCHRL